MDYSRLIQLATGIKNPFITGFLVFASLLSNGQSFDGSYTIGSTGADYSTITSAVTALEAGTINGNVTFTIQAGTYTETIDLRNLNNGSFTVTFSGEDKESVIIQPNGTIDGAGILIDGTNNLVLENFTLQTDDIAVDVVDAFNSDTQGIAIRNADNIQLNNIAETNNGTLNGSTAEVGVVVLILESSNVTAEACTFSGVVGSHFWMENSHTISIADGDFSNHTNENVSGSLSFTELTDLTIHNNDFWLSEFAWGSIYIEGLDAVNTFGFDLENNTFNNLGGFAGSSIYIENFGSVSIKKNVIDEGVFLVACDAVSFDTNTIFSTTEYALGVSSCTDVYIFNNILSSKILGVSFSFGNSENVEFIHNTVYSKGLSGDSMFGSTEGERTIVNNIFVGEGTNVPAFTFGFTSPDFIDLLMDHNLYYAESAIAVQYRNTFPGGENVNFSLSEWQTESGQESNAQFFEPTFASADDLHITSATQLRFGAYIDTLNVDIDGEIRVGALVDVGADQYAGYEINVSQEACESFEFDGIVLTSAGEYAATFTSTHGYDSLVNLDLTIHEIPDVTILVDGIELTAVVSDDVIAYQWLDCDGGSSPIDEATNDTFVATSGSFSVEVSNEFCAVVSECVNPDFITGIGEQAATGISIYPTITDGDIQVEVAREGKALSFYAISISGAVISRENLQDGFNALRIDAPNGLYLIHVFEGSTLIESQRIIKIN